MPSTDRAWRAFDAWRGGEPLTNHGRVKFVDLARQFGMVETAGRDVFLPPRECRREVWPGDKVEFERTPPRVSGQVDVAKNVRVVEPGRREIGFVVYPEAAGATIESSLARDRVFVSATTLELNGVERLERSDRVEFLRNRTGNLLHVARIRVIDS
jgi:cold shock CspA family protein